MKQVWELTKSEFTRAISTDGPEGEGLRQEIAVRYGVADYDYIIRQAVSEGVSVPTTIRETASVRSPRLVRIQACSQRTVRSIRSFGESVSRFLFE
jgi:hypothetical protein